MDLYLLITSAATIGFLHTLFGPDHYLPFIALAGAGKWSKQKTIFITTICGLGHVLSSIILGLFGVAFYIALFQIENIEEFRGEVAGWLLIIFGFLYTLYGAFYKSKKHKHFKFNHTNKSNIYEDNHNVDNISSSKTAWILFLIFVFGPCEPLIPLLIYPASQHNYNVIIIVSLIFSFVTISTMVIIVLIGLSGIRLLPINKLQRHLHSLAGIVILLCGISVQFFGL